MKTMTHNKWLPLLILAILVWPTLLQAQPSRDRILDRLVFNEQPELTEVSIELTFPVRYIRHFPETGGDDLRIQFVPISISPSDRDALFKREAITAKRSNAADISEVVYEGDRVGGFLLTVYFTEEREFSVDQGNDYRSIRLLVKNPDPNPQRSN